LPGGYYGQPTDRGIVVGSKPLWLMKALVRDYSRPGDLICDPCAGGATTLIAAASQGRGAVGAEMDEDTYNKAKQRIEAGYTPDMYAASL
jgi:site-specific DNA-methyltransferase (adenine-specific)